MRVWQIIWRGTQVLSLLIIGISIVNAQETATDACAETGLEVWAQAQIPRNDPPNNLRAAPNTDADILGEIPDAVPIDMLEGPICDGNILWWRVRFGVTEGYTAEAVGEDVFLRRVGSNCPPSELIAGEAATTIDVQVDSIQLYEYPRPDAPSAFAMLDQDGQGDDRGLHLDDRTICVQNNRWWYVEAADGAGWAVETSGRERQLIAYPRLSREPAGVLVERPTDVPVLDPAGITVAYRAQTIQPDGSSSGADVYLVTVGEEPQQLTATENVQEDEVHWSPDGSVLLYETRDRTTNDLAAVFYNPDTGDERQFPLDNRGHSGFTPDGEHLLIDEFNQSVKLADAQTGAITDLYQREDVTHHTLRWANDTTLEILETGDGLIFGNPDESQDIFRVQININTGRWERLPWPERTRDYNGWVASSQGRYATMLERNIVLYDPDADTYTVAYNQGIVGIGTMTWSPDGTRIAFITGRMPHILDTRDGTVMSLLDPERTRGDTDVIVWSPDGQFVVYDDNNRLYIQQADGGADALLISDSRDHRTTDSFGQSIAVRPR